MATQTQQELEALIDGIIIDNNTMQINPAKLRAVLKAINARVPGPSDPSSATFAPPLIYSTFTNTVSIQQATADEDGYLDTESYRRIYVVRFGQMELFKGPDNDPKNLFLEVDDVASFIYIYEEKPVFYMGAYKGGNPSELEDGLPKNWTLIMSNPYK